MSTVTEHNRELRAIVSRRIAEARIASGYSKRRLAKEAGVDIRQLRLWEAGGVEPIPRNLLKLARVLGQSLQWFYEDHDNGPDDA